MAAKRTSTQSSDQQEFPGERPPLFASWKTWYAVVLINLLVLIILFAIFTEAFN